MLADVVQVEADQVLLGLSGVIVGHSSSSLDVPGQVGLQASLRVVNPREPARSLILPDQRLFVKAKM